MLLNKFVQDEGFHIHKLEYIEPGNVGSAVKCMQKLRKLTKGVHPESTEKRSHDCMMENDGKSPNSTKKARVLQAVPTDESLKE